MDLWHNSTVSRFTIKTMKRSAGFQAPPDIQEWLSARVPSHLFLHIEESLFLTTKASPTPPISHPNTSALHHMKTDYKCSRYAK